MPLNSSNWRAIMLVFKRTLPAAAAAAAPPHPKPATLALSPMPRTITSATARTSTGGTSKTKPKPERERERECEHDRERADDDVRALPLAVRTSSSHRRRCKSGGSLGQLRKRDKSKSKSKSASRPRATSASTSATLTRRESDDEYDAADDPLVNDGVGKSFGIAYAGTARVRAGDFVSEAIAAFDVDAVSRHVRATSATSAHLHQVALRLVACVEMPTLKPEQQRALIQITDVLLQAGATPRRGLWTALRYYRRYDHLNTILRFVRRLTRASLKSARRRSAGAGAGDADDREAQLRRALDYAPRPGLPTTWTIVTAARASENNEMRRLAEHVLTTTA
jgi:hypothetical protein